ncbi:hypothetical protein BGZ96_008061 [Linnemannia gamsii]|uniref:Large ribosomal subunit protein eL24-related N-terminal domain-containing protein n=1 Tax=Linnemannia gamsii TaxID=64522 RepID=A0ABQ7K1E1_9FUNG|nr:hypothetical protein BGZ96_008061 [Linnemannia gamsii]
MACQTNHPSIDQPITPIDSTERNIPIEICAFSGAKIYPGKGKIYVRVDNRVHFILSAGVSATTSAGDIDVPFQQGDVDSSSRQRLWLFQQSSSGC